MIRKKLVQKDLTSISKRYYFVDLFYEYFIINNAIKAARYISIYLEY